MKNKREPKSSVREFVFSAYHFGAGLFSAIMEKYFESLVFVSAISGMNVICWIVFIVMYLSGIRGGIYYVAALWATVFAGVTFSLFLFKLWRVISLPPQASELVLPE